MYALSVDNRDGLAIAVTLLHLGGRPDPAAGIIKIRGLKNYTRASFLESMLAIGPGTTPLNKAAAMLQDIIDGKKATSRVYDALRAAMQEAATPEAIAAMQRIIDEAPALLTVKCGEKVVVATSELTDEQFQNLLAQ